MVNRLAVLIWAGTSAALVAGIAIAQEGTHEHHHGPPPEALQACDGLSSGAACSFTHHDHLINGTCESPPERPLACRPAGMRHGPSPTALEACNQLADGAPCRVTHHGTEMDGTCRSGPNGEPPACWTHRPGGPPAQ